ncbi:hypothetical protein GQ42DRAFT_133489 [Ramicandelaber brevisporus]|nr:hypothetical protein GQ42DRAFT_133489 [Ramicandelaber brevisporus]
MSRTSEKANSLLHRYLKSQTDKLTQEHRDKKPRRPYDEQSVETVEEARKWLQQVQDEASRKISRINDETVTMDEEDIMKLNDSINGLLKERRRWETRIEDLSRNHDDGGGDRGKQVKSSKFHKYQYFGRARDLPQVRGILEEQERQKTSSTSTGGPLNTKELERLRATIGPDYYGFRDEDIGGDAMLAYEANLEREWRRFFEDNPTATADDAPRPSLATQPSA